MTAYVDWYRGDRLQTFTTPRRLFDALHAKYDFTLDGAASNENALLPRYSAAEEQIGWRGERVFCNPPWSDIRTFVELAADADLAVLLVPARTNVRWFHRALELGAEPSFFLGRLKFGGLKHNSPVDCMLLIFDNIIFTSSNVRMTPEEQPQGEEEQPGTLEVESGMSGNAQGVESEEDERE